MRISKGWTAAFTLAIAVVVACAVMAATASGGSQASQGMPDWFRNSEKTSDFIGRVLVPSVPYPTAQMKYSLERENVAKRLLRFNRRGKIGYLYVLSFGKFVGYYVVKGKVSSVNSQLTNSDQTWDSGRDTTDTVVQSVGDDGSWGPNEGGDRGIFFFTVTDVMVETTLDWVYSDQPLRIDVPNLLAHAKAKR